MRLSRWRVEWFRYAERRGRLICGLAVAKSSNHPPYGASGMEVSDRSSGMEFDQSDDRESSGVWFGGIPRKQTPFRDFLFFKPFA